MPVDPPAPVLPAARPSASGALSGGAHGDRIVRAARQFDAMFMTEMLRQARPQPNPSGRFAAGQAEKSWQVFMDQALGEAAAAKGGSGLSRAIEQSLRAAGGAPPRAPNPSRSPP